MPGLNKMGPMGQGPMTGRRMGRCTTFGAKNEKPSHENDVHENEDYPERPYGRGWGMGRGWGRGGCGFGMGRQSRFRGGC